MRFSLKKMAKGLAIVLGLGTTLVAGYLAASTTLSAGFPDDIYGDLPQ